MTLKPSDRLVDRLLQGLAIVFDLPIVQPIPVRVRRHTGRHAFSIAVGAWLALAGALSVWAAVPFDQNDGRLLHGKVNSTSDEVKEAHWDDDDASAGTPPGQFLATSTTLDIDGASNSVNNAIRHVRMAHSPKGKEAVAGIGYRETTGTTSFKAYSFDGSSWTLGATVVTVAGSPDQRAFDVAYEQRSGEALVIAGDDTMATPRSPVYWTITRNASTGVWEWSARTTLSAMNLGSGYPRWVQLYSRPGTDEILVLVLSSSSELHAILWTGTGWQALSGPTGTSLIEDSVLQGAGKNFDGAWIANNGSGQRRFIAAYRDNSNDGATQPNEPNAVHFRVLVNTTWQSEKALVYNNGTATNPPDVIVMAGDTNGQRVALASYLQSNNRAWAGIWDNGRAGCTAGDEPACWYGYVSGTSTLTMCGSVGCMWTDALPVLDSTTKTTAFDGGTFPVNVGWAGSGAAQTAVVVYADNVSTSAGLDYATWTAGTWTYNQDLGTGSSGEELSFVVKPFATDPNRLMVAYSDSALSLYEAMFNIGASPQWAVKNFAGVSLPEARGTPFDFQPNRFLVPAISLSASLQLPIRSAGGGASGGPAITISDPAGIMYNEVPGDGDAITAQDLVLVSPVPWDASATCLSVAGTASSKLASGACTGGTKSAILPSATELALDVTTDFAVGDSLLIGTLGEFNTVGQTAGTAAALTLRSNIRPDVTSSRDWDETATSTGTLQLVQSLELSDVAQPGNTFVIPAVQQGTQPADLLKFQLTAVGGSVSVKRLQVTLTPAASTNLTLSNFALTCASSVTFSPAPPASLNVSSLTSLVLQPSNLTVAAATPQTCTLQATVTNLDPNEGLTATLLATDLQADGAAPVSVSDLQGICPDGTCNGSAADAIRLSGATSPQQQHTYSAYGITAPTAGQSITVGAPWTITWQSFGDASPTNVKVEYKTHAVGWTDITTACAITAGQCVTTVPDAASTQAQVRVTDNAVSSITGTSANFNIQVQLTGLTLDLVGGTTWVVGKAHQVQWTQTGSSTATEVALSMDGGANYAAPFATQSVSAPTASNRTANFTPAAAGTQAKVRVRDNEANHPQVAPATVASAQFAIDYAFNAILPGGGSILINQPTTISWATLSGLTVTTVNIVGVRPDASTFAIANNVANSGSRSWTPSVAEDSIRIRICDSTAATVCAEGQQFNVVNPSVMTDKTDYTLGETMQVTWSGMDAIAQVRVLFKPSDASGDIDLLGGGTVAGASGAAGLDWPIPTTLAVPKPGVVRVEDASAPATGANSAATTLHGSVSFLAPTAATRWLINTPQAITWNGLGSMTVRIEWAAQAAGPYMMINGSASSVAGAGNSQAWTPLAAAKSLNAVIRITHATDATVSVTSPAFHVIGQLQMTQPTAGATFDITTPPVTLEWTTPQGPISPVRLRVLDNTSAVIFEDASVTNATSPRQYAWTPATTGQDLRAEVCDVSDTTVCSTSALFTVAGMQVEAPVAAQVFTLGAGGVTVPVQWRPVGGSGTTRLEYRIGGGPLQPIVGAASLASPDNVATTFNWNVPATFADLSDQTQVVATDFSGAPVGSSPAFTIKGALAFTSPSGGTYSVTDPLTISWTTIGQITAVTLGWSTDNCASQTPIAVGANTPNGTTSVNWTIPVAAVSNNLRFCVADAMAGHASTTAMSNSVIVGAKLLFQGLPAGADWVVSSPQSITWTTVGSVSQVQIEYGTESGGVFTPLGIVNGGPLADSGTGTTTINWTVSDIPDLAGDPQVNWTVPFKFRIQDVTAGHPPVPAVSAETLNAYYYHVEWIVKNENGTTISDGVSVVDSSGWTLGGDGWVPGIDPFDGQLRRYRFYKAGTYTTQVSKTNYQPGELNNWAADGHKTLTIIIISDIGATIPIHVSTAHHYDAATQQVTINSWLEQRGVLESNPAILGPGAATVEIYSGNALLATLSDATADSAGQYAFAWDATGIAPGIYFARATIERVGNPVTSGGAFNIEIAGSGGGPGGVTLQELQTELAPIQSGVDAIQTIVAPLPQQLTDAQGALQADIANAQAALGSQIGNVQTTADAIKAETDLISTQVIPKVDGVQAYLADPDAGLPKLLSNQTAMQDQLKAQRRGGILNRDMELEQNETATIRYRSVDDAVAPTITIFTPLGGTLSGAMSLVGPNLFEYPLAAADLGEYRVMVSEPASADSAGTIDSVLVTSVLPRATGQDVTGIAGQLTALSTQLSAVEANLDGKLNAIQTAMATAVQVDAVLTATAGLQADVTALAGQVGTPAQAADLQAKFDALSTLIGVPATGSLAGDIAAIPGAIDYTPQLTALQNSLGALQAAMGTPSQAAALQAVADQVTQLETAVSAIPTTDYTPRFDAVDAAIAAIPGAIDYTSRFDTVEAALTSLSTQVGDPAQRTALDGAIAQLTAIQTDMARDADVQAALGQLTALQGSVDAVSTQVGTPAQAGALATVDAKVDAVQAAIAALPGATDYTPQLTALQGSLDALNTAVGTPSQAAALQAVADQVTQLQVDLAAIPGATDYTAQFTALQSELATLSGQVNDPAQAAALTAVADQVGAMAAAISAVPTADHTATLDALDQAVAGLQADLAMPQAQTGGETATLLTKLAELQKAVESAQGSSAAVGLSQSAYSAASEALKILQQMQADMHSGGGNMPVLLGKFGEQMKQVGQQVTVLPGQLSEDQEVLAQLKKLAEEAKGIASDKGYHFDSLYEMSEEQQGDVKTMRNQVEELKALVEMQRALLERNMNQPVIKTWFEAR